uniref:Cadherin domain-containing protein n=1 Tax=Romanomermis culicivorax TaxID=13658 RepID=A0A915JEM0_ROMCU
NNYTDESKEIVKVQAVDYDADSNADIRFSLKKTAASEDWKYFKMDSIFGRLYPRLAFDYEKQERYYLFIEACDRGDPPLCSECDISIEITDKDDNCPIFDQRAFAVCKVSLDPTSQS